MVSFAKNHGVTALAVPQKVLYAPEIPILGTGKVNYGQVQHIVDELLAGEPAPEVKAEPEPVPDAVGMVEERDMGADEAVTAAAAAAAVVAETLDEEPSAEAEEDALEHDVEELAEGAAHAGRDADDAEAETDETLEMARSEKPKGPDAPGV
jgi:hypothetical protein